MLKILIPKQYKNKKITKLKATVTALSAGCEGYLLDCRNDDNSNDNRELIELSKEGKFYFLTIHSEMGVRTLRFALIEIIFC